AASWCDLNDVPAGARNVDGGSNEGSRRLCTRRSALCQALFPPRASSLAARTGTDQIRVVGRDDLLLAARSRADERTCGHGAPGVAVGEPWRSPRRCRCATRWWPRFRTVPRGRRVEIGY